MTTLPRLALPLALAAVGLVSAGCGSSDKKSDSTSATTITTSAAGKVGVKLVEFKLTPAPTTAPAGTVTFAVRNAGQVKHEFVVIKTTKPAGDLLKGSEADEAGAVGEIGNIPPGQNKTLALKLAAGHYALICNLPGHYKAGQYANFNVS